MSLIDLSGFRPTAVAAEATPVRLATLGDPELAADTRVVRYLISDQSVARDGHTIATSGWQLANFNSNPVFLWCHDDTQPPIGRVTDVSAAGARLFANVTYADAETYPFADTIYRLVRGKFLNAVSVRWLPLDWKFATGTDRAGGIDFLKQELLEVSQCPVPCLPSALATARSAGIDTGPLYEWAERVLDSGGRIAIPRVELEQLRKDARMPATHKRIATPKKMTRGLYTVAALAQLLQSLAYLQASSANEEKREGDDSAVPASLLASVQDLGEILTTMTAEEVAELTPDAADGEATVTPDDGYWMLRAAGIVATRANAAKDKPTPAALARAGKMLSADNQACIRSALDSHEAGCDMLRGLLTKADPDNEPIDANPDNDGTADATRAAEAAALRAARIAEAAALKAA